MKSHKPVANTTYQKARLQVVGYRAIQGRVTELLSDYGINTSQWVILGWLYDHPGGLRVSALGDILEVETPLITALMQPLQEEDLLELNPDPTDGRAKLATLTDKAKRLVPELEQLLAAHLKHFEAAIGAADAQTYFAALEQFIDVNKLQ
jgi:DNA-binding MarR family transcriptional regulator